MPTPGEKPMWLLRPSFPKLILQLHMCTTVSNVLFHLGISHSQKAFELSQWPVSCTALMLCFQDPFPLCSGRAVFIYSCVDVMCCSWTFHSLPGCSWFRTLHLFVMFTLQWTFLESVSSVHTLKCYLVWWLLSVSCYQNYQEGVQCSTADSVGMGWG